MAAHGCTCLLCRARFRCRHRRTRPSIRSARFAIHGRHPRHRLTRVRARHVDWRTAMSIAHAFPALERGASRWLLLGSLAINLFFVGVAIAMAVRAPAPSYWDRNVFVRIERLGATLPPADADILRCDVNANHAPIESA